MCPSRHIRPVVGLRDPALTRLSRLASGLRRIGRLFYTARQVGGERHRSTLPNCNGIGVRLAGEPAKVSDREQPSTSGPIASRAEPWLQSGDDRAIAVES